SARSNLSDANYPSPYTGGRWKILMLCTDERYLQMDNGSFFSTGNHPVETLLPMYHLDKAGFSFDIATLSGNPV
ncbi:protein deglycase HchA, partial [Klebsiella pneumoniae]|nr:protein deglycase HchA [Klebsiella pneumoniae]